MTSTSSPLKSSNVYTCFASQLSLISYCESGAILAKELQVWNYLYGDLLEILLLLRVRELGRFDSPISGTGISRNDLVLTLGQ
jgi:hypothetical protein